jgi:outer membrane protein
MKRLLFTLACGLLICNASLAQTTLKLGYINSQELLSMMPERAKADTLLQQYAKQFQDQGEAMQKEYQAKVQQYQASEKTMTDAIREVKTKEIQDLQSRIEGFSQSAQEKVGQKKQEVYSPILDKADKAIKEIAKEKGYDYIFDASQGVLLYGKDGDNILPLVKAKLGLK